MNILPSLMYSKSIIIIVLLLNLSSCGGGSSSSGLKNDTIPPVITILGTNPLTIKLGSIYSDAGATAFDDRDGKVNVFNSGSVNTSKAATYTITYNASDKAKNKATETRKVIVKAGDIEPPVITLKGSNSIEIFQGDKFNDLGATAYDKVDGTVKVTRIGSVNTTKIGRYTLTYTATDKAGNKTSKTRQVRVKEKVINKPSNLKVTAGDRKITLTWDNVVDADNYTVYMAEESGITPENYSIYDGGIMLENKHSPLVLTKLKNSTTYYFIIVAISKEGNKSQASNEVSGTPQKTTSQVGMLNDTGITRCINGSNADLKCPIAGYPKQDAEFGKNTINFTKIADGKCIKDDNTGLIWEVKQDKNYQHGDSLHDADDSYSWYEPDRTKNGGGAGEENGTENCYGYRPGNSDSYCNTLRFIEKVNDQGWCGYTDWRLPTMEELHSIVDYSRYDPSIDTNYFPNENGNGKWTSETYYNRSSGVLDLRDAWFISFTYAGEYYNWHKGWVNSVRLVRKD